MDERRHNMDGALFVDDEERSPQRERSARPRASQDDGKAEDARRVTQGILDRMELDARVHVREDDEQVVLDIDGPDAGRAIGKKGMTLEALQFLVNKIVNRDPEERRHIVLDSGDYRERHDNGLVSMAKREAKRAISSGRAVTLEPMSARDRRVIHVSLAKFPGVSTRSEGEGTERRLQIIPVRGDRARDERDDRGREDRSERPQRSRPRDASARNDRPRGPVRDERARTSGRPERTPGVDERTYERGGYERAQHELAPREYEREAGAADEYERLDRDSAGDERMYERDPRGYDDPEVSPSREPELRSPVRRDVDARARERDVDARGSARERDLQAQGSTRERDADTRGATREQSFGPGERLDRGRRR